MYSVGNYFLEVLIDPIPGDGWEASAQCSRRDDYRRHARVVKTRFPVHLPRLTKGAAERAAVEWAREFVANSTEVLEHSLILQEIEKKARH